MFDVLVKVSDNDQGTLSIEVTITQNGKAIEEIQFHHREQETPPNEEETIMPPSNDIENVENKTTPTTKPNDTTSTGDTTSYISYMFILLFSFVVIVCLRHMKQHN